MLDTTRAACVTTGAHPDLFDPELGAVPDAIAICRDCPIINDCLDEAMAYEGGAVKSGRSMIWGGMLPGQRYELHAARSRAEHNARNRAWWQEKQRRLRAELS